MGFSLPLSLRRPSKLSSRLFATSSCCRFFVLLVIVHLSFLACLDPSDYYVFVAVVCPVFWLLVCFNARICRFNERVTVFAFNVCIGTGAGFVLFLTCASFIFG